MKKLFWYLLLICIMGSGSSMAIAQSTAGRPCRNSDFDVLPGFITPPPGYGEVPFYWWLGDTLTREHLLDQLEMMKGKGISSLQVNYAHGDKGGKNWGLTLKSEPPIFSDDWWELFGWFMVEANKRGMTVSLSDYTLGAGQEQYVDEILEKYPDLTGYVLRTEEHIAESKPTTISLVLNNTPLTTVAYQLNADSTVVKDSGIALDKNVKNKTLSWKAPHGLWKIVSVYPEQIPLSYDPMNPKAGKEYVAHFFQRFEDKFPGQSKGALNFFFSDELDFRLRGWMWDDYIQKEFLARKGYDIMPHLAELFVEGSDLTPKYRLDYNDVMVSLSEGNFFEPVFNWHEDRGLIFGCDHGGRGKDITEFGDYFRTQRWNQGPGCDQPSLGKDVIKNKVASSIAHLYDRPRTWLEGFYGSGWDTSSAMLLDALYANYAQGQNLLSLHGLYYCTPDGWWEWAPPCNHFRMPYWQEMPALLSCMERLSYLLSQGHHCADVAILYPVEPVIVGDGNEAVQTAFALGEELYSKGIDFDFIDYQSLANAKIKDGKVSIAGENYSVLIIPSMKTIHLESLKKAAELQQLGGMALCVGSIPTATENGANDQEGTKLAASLRHANQQDVYGIISSEITPDFKVATPNPYIMHRKIGPRDVYAVYNVDKGQECYFRAHGGVQLWDPWTGETMDIPATRTDENGTYVAMPLTASEMQLIVFDPAQTATIVPYQEHKSQRILSLNSEWTIHPMPSLDNKWGDFHWPRSNGALKPEIRTTKYAVQPQGTWQKPGYNDEGWQISTLGYGPVFQILGPMAEPIGEVMMENPNLMDGWHPYDMSWRYGVESDYGHQGYHGLKAEIHDEFIRLGDLKETMTSLQRVDSKDGKHYYLYTNVIAPKEGVFQILTGEILPQDVYVNGKSIDAKQKSVKLKKGLNTLLLHYNGACETYYLIADPQNLGKVTAQAQAEQPISMSWNGNMGLLPMTPNTAAETVAYRMSGAPGLESFSFVIYSDQPKVWVNGNEVKAKKAEKDEDGATKYVVNLPKAIPSESLIVISAATNNPKYKNAAILPSPIVQECGEGKIQPGDWANYEGLKYYSGGMKYKKDFKLEDYDASKTYILDLGDVVSTAEVWVNGKRVGMRMSGPWTFDVTSQLQNGDNEFEIVVYNTAHNHYQTIPTRYNRDRKSGIIGPVTLNKIIK